jgi:hypothetical protein
MRTSWVKNYESYAQLKLLVRPLSLLPFQFANSSLSETVTPITPKSNQMEVLVQGKQGKAVTEYLINKGIPKKWIVVDDSTKKKK